MATRTEKSGLHIKTEDSAPELAGIGCERCLMKPNAVMMTHPSTTDDVTAAVSHTEKYVPDQESTYQNKSDPMNETVSHVQ